MQNFTHYAARGLKTLSFFSPQKHFSSALRCSLLLVMTIMSFTYVKANTYTFTFNSGVYSDADCTTKISKSTTLETFYSKDDNDNVYTFTSTGGVYYNGSCLMMPKGSTVTMPTFSNELITTVVFTPTSSPSTSATANVYAGDNEASTTVTQAKGDNTFAISGDYQSSVLTLKNTSTKSKNIQLVTLTITTSSSDVPTKSSANLAFSTTSYSIENGVDEFTAPTFNYDTDATISFSSDNESVATVNEYGEISLAGGEGKATITATSEETDSYYAGTATCTIEVFHYNTYVKATKLESGKSYLIGADLGDGTAFYAYPISGNYGYLYGSTSSSAEEIKVKSLYDDTFTFTQEDDGWTIMQHESKRYLYNTGSYKTFSVAASPAEGQYWTVEAKEDGTYLITNVANSKTVQYSTNYKSFGAYDSEQDGALYPTLYELKATKGTITISAGDETQGYYGTYYNDNAYVMNTNLIGYAIPSAALVNGTIEENSCKQYGTDDVVPAKTALLVWATTPGTYEVEYTESENEAPTDNLLHGNDGAAADAEGNILLGDGYLYYMLSYDTKHENLGFYWGAADGGVFTNGANKAFLAVPASQAAGAKGIVFGNGTVNSIKNIENNAKSDATYSISGVRVEADNLPAGIYVRGGKKFVVK